MISSYEEGKINVNLKDTPLLFKILKIFFHIFHADEGKKQGRQTAKKQGHLCRN